MRKPRLLYPGGLYHVIARGNQRQKIFLAKADFLKYLKLLGEHLGTREIRFYAYCLMPNHVHLLIEQAGEYPRGRLMEEAAYLAFEGCGISQKEIGIYFGINQSAVSQDIRRLEVKWKEQPEEREKWFRWARHLEY